MNDPINWEKRYQDWLKEAGFNGDPSGFQVYQKLMETRIKDSHELVANLQEHFEQIDVILRETPSERSNK